MFFEDLGEANKHLNQAFNFLSIEKLLKGILKV